MANKEIEKLEDEAEGLKDQILVYKSVNIKMKYLLFIKTFFFKK